MVRTSEVTRNLAFGGPDNRTLYMTPRLLSVEAGGANSGYRGLLNLLNLGILPQAGGRVLEP